MTVTRKDEKAVRGPLHSRNVAVMIGRERKIDQSTARATHAPRGGGKRMQYSEDMRGSGGLVVSSMNEEDGHALTDAHSFVFSNR